RRAGGCRRPKSAGVSPASRATRLAAGWMRCCSAQKSRPPSPATTISPSITARGGALRRTGSTTAGTDLAPDGLDHLREVPRHRPFLAAADLHLVAVAKDDRAKAVPFGLVELAGRDRG